MLLAKRTTAFLGVPTGSGSMSDSRSNKSISHHTAIRTKLLHCYHKAPRVTVEASILVEFSMILFSSFPPGHDIKRRSSADGDCLIEEIGIVGV